MAAGWARRLGGEQIEVFSGGSDPAARVNPAAVEAMAEAGVDISAALPRRWTDEIVREADVVVTMGCGDVCPVFPGVRYEDWELADPAGLEVAQVRPIRDEIRDRVVVLLTSLGVTIVPPEPDSPLPRAGTGGSRTPGDGPGEARRPPDGPPPVTPGSG